MVLLVWVAGCRTNARAEFQGGGGSLTARSDGSTGDAGTSSRDVHSMPHRALLAVEVGSLSALCFVHDHSISRRICHVPTLRIQDCVLSPTPRRRSRTPRRRPRHLVATDRRRPTRRPPPAPHRHRPLPRRLSRLLPLHQVRSSFVLAMRQHGKIRHGHRHCKHHRNNVTAHARLIAALRQRVGLELDGFAVAFSVHGRPRWQAIVDSHFPARTAMHCSATVSTQAWPWVLSEGCFAFQRPSRRHPSL